MRSPAARPSPTTERLSASRWPGHSDSKPRRRRRRQREVPHDRGDLGRGAPPGALRLRADRLRRVRGGEQGSDHAAQAVDVGGQRGARRERGRRHAGRRLGGRAPAHRAGAAGRDPGHHQRGRRLRGHRPDARDVQAATRGRVMTTLEALTFLVYLVGSVTFILGLKFLASPTSARRGNRLAATGMAIVVLWVFITEFLLRDGGFSTVWILAVGIPIGSVAGVIGARRVPMTAMPQMVAIFNGAGGGAAALGAAAEFLHFAGAEGELLPVPFMVATLLGAVIGSVSFTGSVTALGQLPGVVSGAPLPLPGRQGVPGPPG